MSEDMKLVASVSITRDNYDTIRIAIKDKNSGLRFVEAHMTPADFAMAITGMSDQPANMVVHRLENVGKAKEIQKRRVHCPFKSYDRKELEKWLVDNCQEDGWELNSYLGSQTSVITGLDGKGCILNYSVVRYV
jgi:hypothetical protein